MSGPAPVTALIPCRNAAPFLGETIASVRAQTRPVAAIIVVDDASTDGSGALARSLGATVIDNLGPHGQAHARNVGLRAAGTEIVALLDADDAWLPHHLERVVPLVEACPDVAVAFGALELVRAEGNAPLVSEPGARVHTPWVDEGAPQYLFERCLTYWIGQPTSAVVRRSAVLAVGGFDQAMGSADDFDLWLRLAPRYRFAATHAITAFWRRHPGQISNQLVLQVQMCFRARRRALERLAQLGPGGPLGVTTAIRIIDDAYELALTRAADRNAIEALLAFAELVPHGLAIRRRWQRRLALPGALGELWLRDGRPIEERAHAFLRRLRARLQRR